MCTVCLSSAQRSALSSAVQIIGAHLAHLALRSWQRHYGSSQRREQVRVAAGRHNKNPDGVYAVRPSKTAAKRSGERACARRVAEHTALVHGNQ